MGCSDFHLSGPLMIHNVYWKQPVTCWLQTLDTNFCLCWDTSLGGTVVQMLDYVYHLLPLCHVYKIYIEVRTNLSSAILFTLYFETFLHTKNRMQFD